MGHLSSSYPNNNTNNKQPDHASTLECTHLTDSMEEEMLMTCQYCQPDPNVSIKTAFSATITEPLYPLGPANDLRNWLIDSGVTLYFTPHPEDLREMESCQIDVTVAD
eukprot:3686514-Ditylum_brightwellii.AAC.1